MRARCNKPARARPHAPLSTQLRLSSMSRRMATSQRSDFNPNSCFEAQAGARLWRASASTWWRYGGVKSATIRDRDASSGRPKVGLASADWTGERSVIWEAELQVGIVAASCRIAHRHKMHSKMRANPSWQYPNWGSLLVAATVPSSVNPSRDASHRLLNSHRVYTVALSGTANKS